MWIKMITKAQIVAPQFSNDATDKIHLHNKFLDVYAQYKCCELISCVRFRRLLSRIIFIPFESIQRSKDQSAVWQQIFDQLINEVSSVVGKVIAVGQWLSSNQGREKFNECLGIVLRGFGEDGKGTRFAKMWACGLMAALKVIIRIPKNGLWTTVLPGTGKDRDFTLL